MLLPSSLKLLVGVNLAGMLTSNAAPIGAEDNACVDHTLFCYRDGDTAPQHVVTEGIKYMCKKFDRLNRTLDEIDNSGIEWYISEQGNHLVSEASRAGPVVPGCDYHITYDKCRRWLTTVAQDCPTHQGGNVTEDHCGLTWNFGPGGKTYADFLNATETTVDCHSHEQEQSLDDRGLAHQGLMAAEPSAPIKVLSAEGIGDTFPATDLSVKRSPQLETMGNWSSDGCYDSGYQRDTTDFMQAATSFCNWFNFLKVEAGTYLTFTYHFCYPDHLDHKIWLSVQVQEGSEPLCMYFAQCLLMMQNFVELSCEGPPVGLNQGGWGVNDHGYLIVDGDPSLHNPSMTVPDLDCHDDKSIKALKASPPPPPLYQQHDVNKCTGQGSS